LDVAAGAAETDTIACPATAASGGSGAGDTEGADGGAIDPALLDAGVVVVPDRAGIAAVQIAANLAIIDADE
jgi:hypothetical protein